MFPAACTDNQPRFAFTVLVKTESLCSPERLHDVWPKLMPGYISANLWLLLEVLARPVLFVCITRSIYFDSIFVFYTYMYLYICLAMSQL